MKVRVAFAGGYTAGHLTPGFALIEMLRDVLPNADVLFLGSQVGPEKSLVMAEDLPFVALPSLPFSRVTRKHKIKSLLRLPGAMLSALKVLRHHRITHLFVLGGHASFTPGIAAWMMGIPVHIIEPNSRFGLANRFLARFASRIFVSSLFNETLAKRDSDKICVTGAPLRKKISRQLGEISVTNSSEHGAFRVLVLGGSLGHLAINFGLPPILAALASRGISLDIVHQAGVKIDREMISAAYTNHGLKATVESYISDMAKAYGECDVIVSAAGAITLGELAMVNRPVIVIPLHDAAAAHQKENADEFAARTGALVVLDPASESEKVIDYLFQLANSEELRASLGERMADFATPNAASDILAEALNLPANGRPLSDA